MLIRSLITLTFIALIIYCNVTSSDVFPFSSFPMYSGRMESDNFIKVRGFLINPSGQSINVLNCVEDDDFQPIQDLIAHFHYQNNDVLADLGKLNASIDLLAKQIQTYETQGRSNCQDLLRLEVSLDYWKNFSIEDIDQPDQSQIILTKALRP